MSRKILFISHDAVRTGAPIALLHLLRWLRRNTTHDFGVILKCDGPLRPEFEALAPTMVYADLDRRVRRNFMQRVLRKAGLAYQADLHRNPLADLFRDDEVGLVYANTVLNGPVLAALEHLRCPRIVHVHELESIIRNNRVTFAAGNGVRYIAAAEAVAANLRDRHGVPADAMTVVHEFIDIDEVQMHASARGATRRALGIPGDAFVVGGAGAGRLRKGQDLFLSMAVSMLGQGSLPNAHFVWVGGHTASWDPESVTDDLNKTPWGDRVHFVGAVPNPYDYFAAFDVFAMTSREDPFPLVNLENAALGTPIVCFAGGGGSPELVGDDAGCVVPYLDLYAFGQAIAALARDPERRRKLGARAAEKVRMRHTTEVGGPNILGVIDRIVASSSTR